MEHLQCTATLPGGSGQFVQCTATLPGGSGQWNSCNALPRCRGAVGSGAHPNPNPNPNLWCGVVWCGVVCCAVLCCVALSLKRQVATLCSTKASNLLLGVPCARFPQEGLLASTNAGGENVARGAALGALLGASAGEEGIGRRWLQGLQDYGSLQQEIHDFVDWALAGP